MTSLHYRILEKHSNASVVHCIYGMSLEMSAFRKKHVHKRNSKCSVMQIPPGLWRNSGAMYGNYCSVKIIDCICDPCAATRNRASVLSEDRETLTVQLVLRG